MKNSKLILRKILSAVLATLLLFSLFCVTGCTESTDETGNTGLSFGIPLRDKTSDSASGKTTATKTTVKTNKPTTSDNPSSVTDTAPSSSATKPPLNSSTKSTNSGEPSVVIPEVDDTEYSVWIPTNGGTKYHSKSTCSNMKNPKQVSLSTAIEEGFEACKRCY